jgi:hypothetical protein
MEGYSVCSAMCNKRKNCIIDNWEDERTMNSIQRLKFKSIV